MKWVIRDWSYELLNSSGKTSKKNLAWIPFLQGFSSARNFREEIVKEWFHDCEIRKVYFCHEKLYLSVILFSETFCNIKVFSSFGDLHLRLSDRGARGWRGLKGWVKTSICERQQDFCFQIQIYKYFLRCIYLVYLTASFETWFNIQSVQLLLDDGVFGFVYYCRQCVTKNTYR